MSCIGVCSLHHALGQTDSTVIVLAPMAEPAESHINALWPYTTNLPVCNNKDCMGCEGCWQLTLDWVADKGYEIMLPGQR